MKQLTYTVKKARSGGEQVNMDLTVLFLLEGSMSVRCQGDKISMRHEDIFLINPGTAFEFSDVRDALYGEASFASSLLSDVMDGRNLILYADSSRDTLHSYQDLRSIFYDLTAEYASGNHKTQAGTDALMLKLLDCLIEHYQLSKEALQSGENESDARMREIMQYIVQHISGEINLSELADQMYVSTSTLSRIFKKNTGMYFTDYITHLRVQSALGLLAHSDQTLTQIAMNCGFSNSAAFNRSFKKITGMNPSEYRVRKQDELLEMQKKKAEEEEAIRETLKEKGYQKGLQKNAQKVEIDAGGGNARPYEKVWQKVINVSSLYELTRANVQFHVLYLQEQLHFEYARFWNIFSTKLMVSDGKTLGQYNFDLIDQTLDFLVQHHIKPFLDFGRRPDAAIKTDGLPVYYREEYIDFQSRKNWEDLFDAFVSHVTRRYGLDEVSGWIFELSRDPDHTIVKSQIYRDPHYDFFNVWRSLYQTVRQRVPGAMAGGVSSVVDRDKDFLKDFYRRCLKSNCTPDFCSFLMFPYEIDNGSGEEETGHIRRRVSQKAHYEEDEIQKIRTLIQESGLDGQKLFITEWNNSISNRNFLNDSCFRSAYLTQKIEELWGQADLLGIMAGSDWVSSYIDTTGIVNGGIGLLTKDTIRKPAFYAIQFLNQMGKNFIARGNHYIATMQDNGDLYILCFYFSWFRRDYMLQDENIDLEKVRHLVLEDERPLKLKIELSDLKNEGNFYIKRRVLNYENGSILDEWGKFQYEKNLTRQDVKYLQDVSTPRILLERKSVGADRRMDLTLELEPQEVSLLHIYKVR